MGWEQRLSPPDTRAPRRRWPPSLGLRYRNWWMIGAWPAVSGPVRSARHVLAARSRPGAGHPTRAACVGCPDGRTGPGAILSIPCAGDNGPAEAESTRCLRGFRRVLLRTRGERSVRNTAYPCVVPTARIESSPSAEMHRPDLRNPGTVPWLDTGLGSNGAAVGPGRPPRSRVRSFVHRSRGVDPARVPRTDSGPSTIGAGRLILRAVGVDGSVVCPGVEAVARFGALSVRAGMKRGA